MDAIEQIKALKAQYFRYLDTKDWTAFRALFTDDFVSDTRSSGGKVVEGADEFVSFVSKTLGARPTVHHGHTAEIHLTSATEAAGIWAMEDLVRMPGWIDLNGFGHYHEKYQKVNDEWRISHSRLTRLRMDIRFLIFRVKLPQSVIARMNAG